MRENPINPFQTAVMPALSSAAFGPLKYSSTTALMGLAEDSMSLDTILSAAACLSVNTILTLMARGVGVSEGVYVTVGVNEGVIVGVLLGVCDGVIVAVAEGVKVGVLEGVNVAVGVRDGVKVGVLEGVRVGVLLGVNVGV